MRKKRILWIVFIALILAADRAVKYIMLALSRDVSFPFGHIFFEIPGFFVVTFVENEGGALGILSGARWFFVAITVAALAFGLYYAFSGRIKHRIGELAFVFLAGGALGNFVDRVATGKVIDMFQFIFARHALINFVFNVADVFVTAGGVLLGVYILFYHDGGKKAAEDGAGEEPAVIEDQNGTH